MTIEDYTNKNILQLLKKDISLRYTSIARNSNDFDSRYTLHKQFRFKTRTISNQNVTHCANERSHVLIMATNRYVLIIKAT